MQRDIKQGQKYQRAQCVPNLDFNNRMNAVAVEKLVGDVEALPFPEHSFDLVISNLSLHWVSVKSV